MNGFISETATIIESEYEDDIKIYRNAVLRDAKLCAGVSVGDDTTIERSTIGKRVAINRRNYINDSIIGDYCYTGINSIINFTRVGKFCSLARNVDIGGFDHDYKKFSTMPMFRFEQMINAKKPRVTQDELCIIGNDVWIASGAQVLHKVKIGDGAVIGGGAVVTKDVPPYAIVAGVPAVIIKQRFSDTLIEQLLQLRWWDWSEDLILSCIDKLINCDVTIDTIKMMKEIADNYYLHSHIGD